MPYRGIHVPVSGLLHNSALGEKPDPTTATAPDCRVIAFQATSSPGRCMAGTNPGSPARSPTQLWSTRSQGCHLSPRTPSRWQLWLRKGAGGSRPPPSHLGCLQVGETSRKGVKTGWFTCTPRVTRDFDSVMINMGLFMQHQKSLPHNLKLILRRH